jgi:hypothetical protein
VTPRSEQSLELIRREASNSPESSTSSPYS